MKLDDRLLLLLGPRSTGSRKRFETESERLLGPRLEPVDDNAVDERREAARAHADRVADRREAEDHVQVGTDLVDEIVPAVVARVGHAATLDGRAHRVDDIVHVLGREEAGDVARREQVVHEDEELLVGDLRVGEEEGDALPLMPARRYMICKSLRRSLTP